MGHTPNPNRSKLDHIDLSFRHNSHRKRISNQNQTRRIANTYSSFTKVLTTHNTTQPFDAKTSHVKKHVQTCNQATIPANRGVPLDNRMDNALGRLSQTAANPSNPRQNDFRR
jgi:hypothetical protein